MRIVWYTQKTKQIKNAMKFNTFVNRNLLDSKSMLIANHVSLHYVVTLHAIVMGLVIHGRLRVSPNRLNV